MTEATPEDRLEQATPPTRDAAAGQAPDVPLEATAADVTEQAAGVGPGESAAPEGAGGELPLEADPADAAEQAAVVELDEDERR